MPRSSFALFAVSGPEIFGLKAEARELLQQRVADDWLQVCGEVTQSFSVHDNARLVIGARDASAALGLLEGGAGAPSIETQAGFVYTGEGPRRGKLALLFSGQGSQYPAMFADAFSQWKLAGTLLQQFDQAFAAHYDQELGFIDMLRSGESGDAAAEHLKQTSFAQPAIGAVSSLAASILRALAVHVDGACGHSFGELTALWASGALSFEDYTKLAVLRGKLMQECSQEGTGMLALRAPAEKVEACIAKGTLAVTLANLNAPSQTVVSGRMTDIETAKKVFRRDFKIPGTILRVAAGFHSSYMKQAVGPFRAVLSETPVNAPSFPVYANVTGEPYGGKDDALRGMLCEQITSPVLWTKTMEALYHDGFRVFVELGPGTTLADLAEKNLGGKDIVAFALDRERNHPSDLKLARLLAMLVAGGVEVSLREPQPWFSSSGCALQ